MRDYPSLFFLCFAFVYRVADAQTAIDELPVLNVRLQAPPGAEAFPAVTEAISKAERREEDAEKAFLADLQSSFSASLSAARLRVRSLLGRVFARPSSGAQFLAATDENKGYDVKLSVAPLPEPGSKTIATIKKLEWHAPAPRHFGYLPAADVLCTRKRSAAEERLIKEAEKVTARSC